MTQSIHDFCVDNLIRTSYNSYDTEDHSPVSEVFAYFISHYCNANTDIVAFKEMIISKYNDVMTGVIDGTERFIGLRLREIDNSDSNELTVMVTCKVNKKEYYESAKDARIIGDLVNNCMLQVSFWGWWRDITKGTLDYCLGYLNGHYGIVEKIGEVEHGITYYQ